MLYANIVYYICFIKQAVVKNIVMNARIFFFAILTSLLFGISNQAYAQASSSVSYTIVITEDMLAQRDAGNDAFGESGRFSPAGRDRASMRPQDRRRGSENVVAFETTADYANSPSLMGDIRWEKENSGLSANVITEREETESGGYLVVMEYN